MLLVVMIVLHGHFSSAARVCNSGIGQIGQAFDPQAQRGCGIDSTAATVTLLFLISAAVALAGSVLKIWSSLTSGKSAGWKPLDPPE